MGDIFDFAMGMITFWVIVISLIFIGGYFGSIFSNLVFPTFILGAGILLFEGVNVVFEGGYDLPDYRIIFSMILVVGIFLFRLEVGFLGNIVIGSLGGGTLIVFAGIMVFYGLKSYVQQGADDFPWWVWILSSLVLTFVFQVIAYLKGGSGERRGKNKGH